MVSDPKILITYDFRTVVLDAGDKHIEVATR